MNIYISQMKSAVDGFYTTAKTYAQNVERAKSRYQPDVAAGEVRKLDASLEAARRGAVSAVKEAQDKGIEAARRWGSLDGSKITEDTRLLKYEIPAEQFEALVERYRDNASMCFVLAQYAENHKSEDGAWYSVSRIPTVEAKISAYTRFADSAIRIIDSMTGNGWGRGVDSPVVAASVETFGQPDAVNAEMLEIIS